MLKLPISPLISRAAYPPILLRPATLTARYTSSTPKNPSTSTTTNTPDQKSPYKDPSSSNKDDNNDDRTRITLLRDEYSKSTGGDDHVAHQTRASFQNSQTTDPARQKEQAGKGNEVNPLEVSPATPEVSAIVDEVVVVRQQQQQRMQQELDDEKRSQKKSGMGVGRKGKKVEHTQIDFEKIRMKGR